MMFLAIVVEGWSARALSGVNGPGRMLYEQPQPDNPDHR